jgi:hypothetical protein
MTNHHCAHECIEDLSTSGRDYVAEGFFAKEGSDEHRCPTVEINRLVEITDVTKRIQGATKGLSGAPFNDAQKAEMSKTEKECSGESDRVRCEVVTLYNGGKFDLYHYQRYQDVRLKDETGKLYTKVDGSQGDAVPLQQSQLYAPTLTVSMQRASRG